MTKLHAIRKSKYRSIELKCIYCGFDFKILTPEIDIEKSEIWHICDVCRRSNHIVGTEIVPEYNWFDSIVKDFIDLFKIVFNFILRLNE